MFSTIRLAAVTAVLGWAAMNAGEAAAQVIYGYPPAMNVSPVYPPPMSYGYAVPGWSGGGYRYPATVPAASRPMYYPAVNGGIPAYSYPAGTYFAPAVTQPVTPGAGFFSVTDPYLSSPGTGASTPSGTSNAAPVPVPGSPFYTQPVYTQPVYTQPLYTQPVNTQPVYPQPFYTQPETVVPNGGSSLVNPAGGSYVVPSSYPSARPAAPVPTLESPFYR